MARQGAAIASLTPAPCDPNPKFQSPSSDKPFRTKWKSVFRRFIIMNHYEVVNDKTGTGTPGQTRQLVLNCEIKSYAEAVVPGGINQRMALSSSNT
jgi:hypothetical protein